jgi:hypothetical protein
MANPKTQLKLKQLSGSLATNVSAVANAAAIADTSLQGPLDHVATSIKRVLGHDYFNSTASELKDAGGTARIDYVDSAAVNIRDEAGAIAVAIGGASANDKTAIFSGNIVIPNGGNIGSAGDTNAIAISNAGQVQVTATTNATSATDGALRSDGGLSVAADGIIGNDLSLLSDSAVLALGAGKDATFTHDGTTGLTIAATPISVDSTGVLDLSSTTGDINFQDAGVNQLALDLDGTAGEVRMKLMVDSDDFVFQQYELPKSSVLKITEISTLLVDSALQV